LITTEAQKAQFFVFKQTGFFNQMFPEFIKMALTRVRVCDSSRVIW